ncbi:MAG: phosphoesterase [Clostridiales bacterium]|jgi:predicted metal-dependent phosphoesterase TrpH|nr:phosphoesterase [Clostridiales bacterium]
MRYFYDLHIHSALSPCADNDMTPNNIMGMAAVNGLNIIAVADHNSIKNVGSFLALQEEYDVTVVPAFELQTAEDIHFLCLFPDIGSLTRFYDGISFGDIKNNKTIFGDQLIFDAADNVVGEEERMLLASADIYSYRVRKAVREAGGVAVPAHIDRETNGMVSILGNLDDDYDAVEFSPKADGAFRQIYGKNRSVLIDSDSHMLGTISEAVNAVELDERSAKALIKRLYGRL